MTGASAESIADSLEPAPATGAIADSSTATQSPPDRVPSRSGGLGVTIALALAASVVVMGIGFVVWKVIGGTEREPKTVEFVIPKGTKTRQKAGEKVVVMPSHLELQVGDRMILRNEDVVRHPIGPYMVRALNEITVVYGAPGVYEGYCPLSDGEQYKIVVTE
ncbi:MAG: hypothetical protein R2735_07135 [Microthrixaceae bacterium]